VTAKGIQALERRVTQAVGRLRELSAESERLRGELAEARQRLDASPSVSPEDLAAAGTWDETRREAVSLIEETLSELRAMESVHEAEGD